MTRDKFTRGGLSAYTSLKVTKLTQCSEGLLGFSSTIRVAPRPTLLPVLKNVTDIVCGVDHVLALTSTGKVFSWGNGQQLQLGRRVVERTRLNNLYPREFGLKNIKTIGAGSYHSFAIAKDGTVYAWGLNQFGQCGIDRQGFVGEDGAVIASPSIVDALEGYNIVEITGGEHHSLALTSTGQVLSFGRMDCNQLGFPDSSPPETAILDSRGKPRFTPYPTVIPSLPPVRKIFCGSHHNVAIAADGAPWSWGFGEVWQTGHGPHTQDNPSGDVAVPTMIVNTATKGVRMVTGGAGGQFSVLCGVPLQN
jgi:regulator of chromosome condensation